MSENNFDRFQESFREEDAIEDLGITEKRPIPKVDSHGIRSGHALVTVCLVAVALVLDGFFALATWSNPNVKSISALLVVILGTYYVTMVYARGFVRTAETLVDLRASKRVKIPHKVEGRLLLHEHVWDITRQDTNVLHKWIILTVPLLVAPWGILGLSWMSLAASGLVALPLAVRLLYWYNHIYGFTDERIFARSGVVSDTFREAPLNKVTGINYHVSKYEGLLAFLRINYVPSGRLLLGLPKDDDDDPKNQALTTVDAVPEVVYHMRRSQYYRTRKSEE